MSNFYLLSADGDVHSSLSPSPTSAVEDSLSLGKVWQLIQQKENIYKLMGSGFTWFLFDIVAYGASLLVSYFPVLLWLVSN